MTLYTGKLPATDDDRDLKLAHYVDWEKIAPLPKRPAQFGHGDKMPLPRLMLGNGPDDSVFPGFGGAGDCVFAMICNAIRLAHGIAGSSVRFTGREAIAAYSEVTGYDPNDPSTDRGTNMRDALKWWRNVGIADADGERHKLAAFAILDMGNLDAELEALYLMDVGVAAGIKFPDSAMTEFGQGKPWAKTGQSDEGHAILWDAHRKFEVVETWARAQPATAGFMRKQMDEGYALFLPEMLVDGKSPEGFDRDQLARDLAAL